jgi:hypothetical protein
MYYHFNIVMVAKKEILNGTKSGLDIIIRLATSAPLSKKSYEDVC